MIRRIQALNYRCLRHVDVALDPFHVLVGPNASGKSTLFDVVTFLGDMVRDSLGAAVAKRTGNFQDLVWGRLKDRLGFELAVEFDIPDTVKNRLPSDKNFKIFRYEVAIKEGVNGAAIIDSERGLLMPHRNREERQLSIFPFPLNPVNTILLGGGRPGIRTILSKSEGTDNFNIRDLAIGRKGLGNQYLLRPIPFSTW